MKRLSFILLFFSFLGWSQRGEFSLEEIEKLRQNAPKPVWVLLTTDWCAVCQIQKRNLKKIPTEVWDKVYFTSINPEKYRREISFLGKRYAYVANGASGLHKIAYDWAGGRVPAYPLWVFIDEQGNFATYEGLLKPEELQKISNEVP